MGMSKGGKNPAARTLEKLREDGYTADVVERYLFAIKRRKDFCGGIDVIAFRGYQDLGVCENGPDILGVQCCSDNGGAGLAGHREKLLAEPRMREWISAGGRLVIHAWGKKGARGKRKTWTCREIELSAADFKKGNEA